MSRTIAPLAPGISMTPAGALLIGMMLGFTLYFVAVLLVRLRAEILRRERSASWIREAAAA